MGLLISRVQGPFDDALDHEPAEWHVERVEDRPD
jgi:hypothetical protein